MKHASKVTCCFSGRCQEFLRPTRTFPSAGFCLLFAQFVAVCFPRPQLATSRKRLLHNPRPVEAVLVLRRPSRRRRRPRHGHGMAWVLGIRSFRATWGCDRTASQGFMVALSPATQSGVRPLWMMGEHGGVSRKSLARIAEEQDCSCVVRKTLWSRAGLVDSTSHYIEASV